MERPDTLRECFSKSSLSRNEYFPCLAMANGELLDLSPGASPRGREVSQHGVPSRQALSSNAPDFTPFGMGYGLDPSFTGLTPPYWMWGNTMPSAMPALWREFRDQDGTPYFYNSKTGLTQWERPLELQSPFDSTPAVSSQTVEPRGPSQPIHSTANVRELGAVPSASTEREEPRRGGKEDGGGKGRGKRRTGKSDEQPKAPKKDGEFGPPGCNLFVFHLPDDWTDEDLNEYFHPHGRIVSAKVMKELGTGRSRGFGFVSYEDRIGAATAIKKMQGFKVLGKRLKVEFKKGEQGDAPAEEEEQGGRGAQDDERLIGYLRAISAKNVVQSLKESERLGHSSSREEGWEEDQEGAGAIPD